MARSDLTNIDKATIHAEFDMLSQGPKAHTPCECLLFEALAASFCADYSKLSTANRSLVKIAIIEAIESQDPQTLALALQSANSNLVSFMQ